MATAGGKGSIKLLGDGKDAFPHEFTILYHIAVVLKYLKQDAESLKMMNEAKTYVIKGQEKTAAHLFKEYAEGRYQLLR